MKRFLLHTASILIFCTSLFADSGSLDSAIKKEVTSFFFRVYHVAPEKMVISYLRFPDVSAFGHSNYEIRISSQKLKPRLGYQTLWVELSENRKRVKRFPISLDIGMEVEVVVANTRINRHQTLKPELLRTQVKLIKEDWDILCHSVEEVAGNESTKVIHKDAIVNRKLFRPVPLIRRGDIVEVRIEAGNLVLTSNAVAKTDGGIGDKLQVESLPGGKRLKTTVKGPGLVYFSQENTL